MSGDGRIVVQPGAATNLPFTGTTFSPRVWNGRFCATTGSIGSTYCSPAFSNSTGVPGRVRAVGSSVVTTNALTLEALDLPLGSFGFFLTSRTQGYIPQPGGSQGALCLGSGIGRYVGPGQIRNSGTSGQFELALDLTQTPTPNGLVAVAAGETWNFQAWYRDANPGATSNFTDGVSVQFH
jgi:hypothetical protein